MKAPIDDVLVSAMQKENRQLRAEIEVLRALLRDIRADGRGLSGDNAKRLIAVLANDP